MSKWVFLLVFVTSVCIAEEVVEVPDSEIAGQPACVKHYAGCDVPCGNPDFPGFKSRLLSPRVPHDIDRDFRNKCLCYRADCDDTELSVVDRLYAILAWQTFVAIQWPHAGTDPARSLAGPGIPAWSAWVRLDDLFAQTGSEMLVALTPGSRAQGRFISLSGVHFLTENDLAPDPCGGGGPSFPVWDQNGNQLTYETLFNPNAEDYTCTDRSDSNSSIYTKNGQIGFTCDAEINFSWGQFWKSDAPHTSPALIGSILVKIAWKTLSGTDDPTRFILNPRADSPQGIVAFHVVHKTKSARSWTWATFEHIDSLDPEEPGRKPLFRDPGCTTCPANECPAPGADGRRRTQIERLVDISAETEALNSEVRRLLTDAGSVLQHYRLVASQWPVGNDNDKPRPAIASNPMVETYNQRSSCMDCHRSMARVPALESCEGLDRKNAIPRQTDRVLSSRPADHVIALRHAPWTEEVVTPGSCESPAQ